MQFIVDSGSTKTNWALVDKGTKQCILNTEGYNPYFFTTQQIIDSLKTNMAPQLQSLKLSADNITEVNFYDAGCSNSEKKAIVSGALGQFFRKAKIFVGHDLLGAARALLQHNKGFAAILGTGTNTGIYNGKDDLINIDSLGHFFGDEGSGCYNGKKLLRDRMRGYLPKELDKKLTQFSPMGKEEILDHAYNYPLPNRFVAGFFRFIDENKEHEYCKNLVRESFEEFFKKLVTHYENYKQYELNCVGSVGFIFRDILKEVSLSFGMQPGLIIQEPIDGMVTYHLS
jgi:glucosamine kinase